MREFCISKSSDVVYHIMTATLYCYANRYGNVFSLPRGGKHQISEIRRNGRRIPDSALVLIGVSK